MAQREIRTRYDAVVVGGGHNGLVAATLLARGGRSVVVLERRDQVGGAAVSGTPFPGVGARMSRYSYLVSLFPAALAQQLGLRLELRPRAVASYTPCGDSGLLVERDGEATRESMSRITGDPQAFAAWERFYAMVGRVAARLAPTLMEPLHSRAEMRRLIDDETAWRALFEEPLSDVLERSFGSDLVRGVVLTDALIGTFAAAGDPSLRQNRCFLYHVIGNGTGRWDVPVGGMGALTDALCACATRAGAEIRTHAEVAAIGTNGIEAEVQCTDGRRFQGRHVLANVAPSVLSELLGETGIGAPAEAGRTAPVEAGRTAPAEAGRTAPAEVPEGAQLKINMLLARLPQLRDRDVPSSRAFAGTFHVNEGYEQLQCAFEDARGGRLPQVPPCELYCHSLTDATILSSDLRDGGAHTLTLFGLHMPAALFRDAPDETKARAVAATLRSVNSMLAEPVEDCLWPARDGTPCLEALTPLELEAELGMPGGHIFHRDLAWPFAESEREVGHWGVETDQPNVWVCGAGARRGGGVSGIPGHNAARAVLAAG